MADTRSARRRVLCGMNRLPSIDQTRSHHSSFPIDPPDSLARSHDRHQNPAMTVIAFLGAGSVVFTRELLADLLSFDELRDGLTLALHDIDPERLETAEAIARRTAEQLGARPVITTSLDRRSALDGADFVINAIQVGMYAA